MTYQSTATTAQTATGGCGCVATGGAATGGAAFVRPNFFAGQLLTEDDLQALTGYVTGKSRLRNRMLFGPGVVCGLEVLCDPCGGGQVTVRPGYALDCCGNDLVVDCPQRVDVNALVRDLRIRLRGVDCGDDCGSGGRAYGLFLRYAELPTEPVAPYPTTDGGSGADCAPSRIRETYSFVVGDPVVGDHRYRPGTVLADRFGDPGALAGVRTRDGQLVRYQGPLRNAVATAGGTVEFDQATADRLSAGLEDLRNALAGGQGQLPADRVPAVTELVRVLAAAVARYDVSDHTAPVGELVAEARALLGTACARLEGTDTLEIWGDEVSRTLAGAVRTETVDRLTAESTDPAPLELRMLAQGAPLSYQLRALLNSDLAQRRQWLMVRFDTAGALTDCAVADTVTDLVLPAPLPAQPTADRLHPSASELATTATALRVLHHALLTFLADSACASLHPPVGGCTDTDLLLAVLTVRDCQVVDVCTAGREQVLPGGSGYSAWLPVRYQAEQLAAEVCCQPVSAPEGEPDRSLPLLADLFGAPAGSTLDELLALLMSTVGGGAGAAAGTFGGVGIPAGTFAGPAVAAAAAPVVDPVPEALADLGAQVAALTGALAALRGSAPTAGTGSSVSTAGIAGTGSPASGAAPSAPAGAAREAAEEEGPAGAGAGDGDDAPAAAQSATAGGGGAEAAGAGEAPDAPARAAARRGGQTRSAPAKSTPAKPGQARGRGRGGQSGQGS